MEKPSSRLPCSSIVLSSAEISDRRSIYARFALDLRSIRSNAGDIETTILELHLELGLPMFIEPQGRVPLAIPLARRRSLLVALAGVVMIVMSSVSVNG